MARVIDATGRDWTRPVGRRLRLQVKGARDAGRPTTSSDTGRQRRQAYCVVYLSARHRALVTTWKGREVRSDVNERKGARRDAANLGRVIQVRLFTSRGAFNGSAAYPWGANDARLSYVHYDKARCTGRRAKGAPLSLSYIGRA